MLNAKTPRSNITETMLASLSVIHTFESPVIINDRPCVDGDLALPLPVKEAIKLCRPTDILIIANHPLIHDEYLLLSRWKFFDILQDLQSTLYTQNPRLKQAEKIRHRRLRQELGYLLGLKNINVGIIDPSDNKVSSLTKNKAVLFQAVKQSIRQTLRIFGNGWLTEQTKKKSIKKFSVREKNHLKIADNKSLLFLPILVNCGYRVAHYLLITKHYSLI